MALFGVGNRRKSRQTVAHEYYLGMHMVVGHANIDAVERIRVGEKVAWTPTAAHPDASARDFHNVGDDGEWNAVPSVYEAQTFTVSGTGYYASAVRLRIYRGAGLSTTSVSISNVDSYNKPDDSSVVGNSAVVNLASIPIASPGDWVVFTFATAIYLASDTQYAIVLKPAAGSVSWRLETAGTYTGGMPYLRIGGVWSQFGSFDAMFEIYLSEGTAPNHTIRIEALDLFGGNRKEGGIRGKVHLLFGASDQAQNSYLVSRLSDANLPAFRGSMGFVLNQVYIGTSPYPKPWSFFCRRLLKQVSGDAQWYIEKAVINEGVTSGDDLNPAHIIRECLIDIDWGMGFTESDIDSTSFELAADILFDEDFGLSYVWDQTEPIEDFIGSVLSTIAGFLYQDLSTGKWVLSLTRATSLPPNSILSFEDSYNVDDNGGVLNNNSNWYGQTFTPSLAYTATSVRLKVYSGTPGTININLYATSAGKPTGASIATASANSSSFDADPGSFFTFDLDVPVALSSGVQYAIVVEPVSAGSAACGFRRNTAGNYGGGTGLFSGDQGSSWTVLTSQDFMFEIYSGLVSIKSFNENHIMNIEEFARPSYGEVINQVTVNWWDKIASKSRPVVAQDIALIEKQSNNIIELNLNHYGVCNAALANKIAERELKLVSSMLASMRLKCTRQMSHLKPNDVFSLSWDELGIVQMIVRVIDVDYGSLQKSEIYMTCLEDVFSTAETVFADPPDTEWTDPINDALDISDIDIIEVPYWILVHDIENQDVVDTDYADDVGYLLLAVAPPTSDSLDFEIFLQQAAEFSFNSEGIAPFTFNATLTTGMFQEAQNVTVDIENTFGLNSVLDDSYAVIGNEMVKVVSVDTTNDQVTLERGVFDTVPEAHAVGVFVYFIGDGYTSLGTEYTDGDQPAFKILPRTGTGQLLEASASTQTADLLDSRFVRPYPPGNLKFNAESFPTFLSTAITGGFEITWSHRDRTHATQVGTIVLHTDATNYGPEAGTTYTIKIYDEDDVLARTVTGIAGTAYEYTEAFEIADNGALQKQLRFEIYAVRGGFDSWLLGYDVLIKRTLVGVVSAVSAATGYLIGGKTLIRGTVAASSAATGTLTVL